MKPWLRGAPQEFASRFRSNANTAAQRAQAAAGSATDRMRESFASMKMLSFSGLGRNSGQPGGGGGGGSGGGSSSQQGSRR